MRKLIVCLIAGLFLLSCSSSVDPRELYGEWEYVKILNVRSPEESTTKEEIAEESPSIRFSENNDLVIMWGGKQLSHGKFRIEGNMIRYTENLPDGKTREFPFLISELTEDKLVFETMENQATRVTARRRR